jgi:hypothetical protein
MIEILAADPILSNTKEIVDAVKKQKKAMELLRIEHEELTENEAYRIKLQKELAKTMDILEPKYAIQEKAIKNVEDAQKSLNEEIDITISRLSEFDDILSAAFDPLSNVLDAYADLEEIFRNIDEIKFDNIRLFQEKDALRTYDPEFYSKMKEAEERINSNNKQLMDLNNSLPGLAISIQKAEASLIDALAEAQRKGIDPYVALEQILGSMSGIAPDWVIQQLRDKMFPLLDRFQGDVEELFQDEMIAEIAEKERRLQDLSVAEANLAIARQNFTEAAEKELYRIIEEVPPKNATQMNIMLDEMDKNFDKFKDDFGDKWGVMMENIIAISEEKIKDFENKVPDTSESAKNIVERYMDKVMSDNSMVNVPNKSFQEMSDEEKRKYIQDAYMGNTTIAPKYDPFKAMGGPVNKNSPYIVGEQGPELFVPNQSGKIIPNHDLMGYNKAITNVFQTRELNAAELAQEVEWRQSQQLKGRQR